MGTSLHALSGAAKGQAVLVAAVSQKVLRFLGAGHKLGRSSSRVTPSIDDNMTPGIRSVATPVYDHSWSVIAGVAIVAQSVRASHMKLTNLVSATLDTDAEISRDIGCEVPVTQKNSRPPASA